MCRSSLALVLVAAFPALGIGKDDPKPTLPPLNSKEWKKNAAGLEIWDVKEGKGEAVKPGAAVQVHYTGWLTNGEIFDSSVLRKEPVEFPLDGVIKGWQEGIPGMKTGGIRRLKIPPALAYGDKARPKIPANSTLVFEVELLSFVEKPVLPKLDAKEWKKLGSGLETWDVKEGKGDAVKPGTAVRVHYTGWLTSGEIFDSSVLRGEPVEFSLNGVIKGWQEGIPGMKPGGIRRLKIPPALAYGEKARSKIPANSTLVFEVELLPPVEKPMLPKLDAKEWKKLESGLEVWDVKEGEGDAVKPGATVTVHYTGWLTDGKEFDSSLGGKPATFPLSRVIKGWEQGIPGMKPGGIRRLKIPSELGYGKEGSPPEIPPNATLVFEVQLIK